MVDYSSASKTFNDPLVRCYDCGKLVHRLWIAKFAGCSHCGSRKFRNIQAFTEEELVQVVNGTFPFGLRKEEWYPVDPDFMVLFERVGEANA
jgi:hypothetical protein